MPIRFRCPHCFKLLGIATRKAGTDVPCPQCGRGVTVPRPADNLPDADDLDDIDQILGHAVGSNGAPAPGGSRAATAAPKPPKPAPAPRKTPGDSLFETGDVDTLLGLSSELPPPEEDVAPPRPAGGPKPVTGMDVQSLDGGGTWVVSPQKAALLVVALVALLLIAFGSGFLIASLL